MNIDIEAMKAAALAATPGEWHAPGLAELHDASNRVIACFSDVDPVPQEERPQPDIEEGDRNARFAATANPAAVLALIERLQDEHAANAMLIEENDRLQARLEATRAALQGEFKLPDLRGLFLKIQPDCWKCYEAQCTAGVIPSPRVILCPTCGNKRCPRASDHALDCTGSNEPGQPGSIY